ncbi:Uncharacterised protein [Halioglobus japonicus]|nr:Uncharacterised protein [Halioglobus japonicus]
MEQAYLLDQRCRSNPVETGPILDTLVICRFWSLIAQRIRYSTELMLTLFLE